MPKRKNKARWNDVMGSIYVIFFIFSLVLLSNMVLNFSKIMNDHIVSIVAACCIIVIILRISERRKWNLW